MQILKTIIETLFATVSAKLGRLYQWGIIHRHGGELSDVQGEDCSFVDFVSTR
jgi:hypothetical protein